MDWLSIIFTYVLIHIYCYQIHTATMAAFVQLFKLLLVSMTIIDFIFVFIAGFMCLYLLDGSRKAKSKRMFKTYHIVWHIAGGLLMSYIVYLEHKAFHNLDHPIIQLRDYLFSV